MFFRQLCCLVLLVLFAGFSKKLQLLSRREFIYCILIGKTVAIES